MIPPGLALSAASSVLGLLSSVASSVSSKKASAETTTTSPATTGITTTTKPKANDVVNQADFMKLLIAQLQNQDPLNPADSANFSAQLAQFSSLEQLTQINQKLDQQAGGTVNRFEAVAFIGREVTGASLGIAVEGGVATTLDYTLDRTGAVQANIINSRGELVANLSLGSQEAGAHQFDLATIPSAPNLEDGTYAVVLTQANPAGGAATTINTYITGRVTGVDLTGDTPVLLLGKRQLFLADVTEIKEAAANTAP